MTPLEIFLSVIVVVLAIATLFSFAYLSMRIDSLQIAYATERVAAEDRNRDLAPSFAEHANDLNSFRSTTGNSFPFNPESTGITGRINIPPHWTRDNDNGVRPWQTGDTP